MNQEATARPVVYYVYDNQQNILQDVMKADGRSMYGNQTAEEIKAEHGDKMEILPYEQAVARMENACKTAPQEISEDDYYDQLNVLPPSRWVNAGGAESFHCCEIYSGSVSRITVRIGTRFFSYRDTITLTHAERVAKCTPLLATVPAEA